MTVTCIRLYDDLLCVIVEILFVLMIICSIKPIIQLKLLPSAVSNESALTRIIQHKPQKNEKEIVIFYHHVVYSTLPALDMWEYCRVLIACIFSYFVD